MRPKTHTRGWLSSQVCGCHEHSTGCQVRLGWMAFSDEGRTCSSLAEKEVELTDTPMGSRVWSSNRVGSPPTVRRSQIMLMSGHPSSCSRAKSLNDDQSQITDDRKSAMISHRSAMMEIRDTVTSTQHHRPIILSTTARALNRWAQSHTHNGTTTTEQVHDGRCNQWISSA